MQNAPVVDKLASRFGGSAIAKQAAQQALLNRVGAASAESSAASSSQQHGARQAAHEGAHQEVEEELPVDDESLVSGGSVQLFASQSGMSRTSSRYESPRGQGPQPYQPTGPGSRAGTPEPESTAKAAFSRRSVEFPVEQQFNLPQPQQFAAAAAPPVHGAAEAPAAARSSHASKQQPHGPPAAHHGHSSRSHTAGAPDSPSHHSSHHVPRDGAPRTPGSAIGSHVPSATRSSSNNGRRPVRTTSSRGSAGGGSLASVAAALTHSSTASPPATAAAPSSATAAGQPAAGASKPHQRAPGRTMTHSSSSKSARIAAPASPHPAAPSKSSASHQPHAAAQGSPRSQAADEEEELLEVLSVLHAKSKVPVGPDLQRQRSRSVSPSGRSSGGPSSRASPATSGQQQQHPVQQQQQHPVQQQQYRAQPQQQQHDLVQAALDVLNGTTGPRYGGTAAAGGGGRQQQDRRGQQYLGQGGKEDCGTGLTHSLAPIKTRSGITAQADGSSGGFIPGSPSHYQQQQQQLRQQPVSPQEKEAQAEAFFEAWRLRKHHPETPDYKYSQAAADGPLAPVKQQLWNFDQAHPALADQHYLRTYEQNKLLEQVKAGADPSTPQQPPAAGGTALPWRPGGRTAAAGEGPGSPLARSTSSPFAADAAIRGLHAGLRSPAGGSRRGTAGGVSVPSSPAARLQERTKEMMSLMRSSMPAALSRGSSGIPAATLSKSPMRRNSRTGSAHSAAEDAIAASRHLTRRMSSSARRQSTTSRSAVLLPGGGVGAGLAGVGFAGRSLSPEDRQYISGLEAKVDVLQRSLQLLMGGAGQQAALAAAAAAGSPEPVGSATTSPRAAAATGADQGGMGVAARAASPGGASRPGMGELSGIIHGLNQAAAGGLLQRPTRSASAVPAGAEDRSQLQQQQQASLRPQSALSGTRTLPAASTAGGESGAALGKNSRPDPEATAKKEMMIACGAFDEDRYQAYEQQLEDLMHRRAAAAGGSDGYDSDLERDAAAREAAGVADKQQSAAEAGRQLQEDAEREAAMAAAWEQENAWMDAYRRREEDLQEAADNEMEESGSAGGGGRHRRRTTSSEDEQARLEEAEAAQQEMQEYARRMAAARGLTGGEELLVQQPFVPLVSPDFPQYAVMSDMYHAMSDNEGTMLRSRSTWANGSSGATGYMSDGPGDGMHSSRHVHPAFKTTIPKAFTFEQRAKMRPKTIAAIKLEQDLQLKLQAEDAVYNTRFQANPVPASTTQPRYEAIITEQEAKRAAAHDSNAAMLASLENPFTFYYRDREAAAAKEAAVQAARDPNRFQRRFKANPVPSTCKEQLFSNLQATWEAKRVASRVKQQLSREKARARLEESHRSRQAAAAAAYTSRLLNGADMQAAGSRSRSRSRPGSSTSGTDAAGLEADLNGRRRQALGALATRHGRPVPDFSQLHDSWYRRLAAAKATNKRRVTVPEEFLLNGSTPEKQAERAAKAEERRQRIMQDIARDQEQLTELRWPYKSTRAPVKPTPPPAANELAGPEFVVGETLAARLRAHVVRSAIQSGHYATAEEREQREKAAAAQEVARRAKKWAALQEEALRRRMQGSQQLQTGAADADDAGAASTTASGRLLDASLRASGQLDTGRQATMQRRLGLTGRKDAPVMHIEARHAQAQEQARALVEEALLQQGIAAYRYVEG